ncbi:hypothetical protein HY632_05370 [Candidatus Uhrbacteria bacterium]|nr:hypothetical protein [Candidatus Uhrbacteria bacterium]
MSKSYPPARYRRRGSGASGVAAPAAGSRDWRRRGSGIMMVLLVASVIGYLGLTNDNATAGYELRKVERKAEALREATRRLDRQVLAAQAMDALAAHVTAAGFVPVAHVEYLVPGDRAVARVP